MSLYVDQRGEGDLFQERAARHPGMKICPTIEEALTLGTGKLAVDGVFVVAEHGVYPLSENSIMMRPHYEFFEQITKVFRASGRSVPYFNDKELSCDWNWSKKMVDVSHELNFPLQGGSSLEVTWRVPSVEFPLGATTKEALSVAGLQFRPTVPESLLEDARAGNSSQLAPGKCDFPDTRVTNPCSMKRLITSASPVTTHLGSPSFNEHP